MSSRTPVDGRGSPAHAEDITFNNYIALRDFRLQGWITHRHNWEPGPIRVHCQTGVHRWAHRNCARRTAEQSWLFVDRHPDRRVLGRDPVPAGNLLSSETTVLEHAETDAAGTFLSALTWFSSCKRDSRVRPSNLDRLGGALGGVDQVFSTR